MDQRRSKNVGGSGDTPNMRSTPTPTPTREPVVAAIGDTITCPGCKERVTLDWADGWRNDRGFTCWPLRTTHSDHIETIRGDR